MLCYARSRHNILLAWRAANSSNRKSKFVLIRQRMITIRRLPGSGLRRNSDQDSQSNRGRDSLILFVGQLFHKLDDNSPTPIAIFVTPLLLTSTAYSINTQPRPAVSANDTWVDSDDA
ncbi:hypothetical protein J6590_030764 [Homalodisca vitripennis]|nr:hypothetical protein J6590_030764 [Homalodisca vitripennis]